MDQANPQLEDGFTRVAHEVLEALAKCGVSGSVFRLVLAVIRETYGYNEKERRVTRARLAEILGVSERRVRQLLREAEKANMIVVKGWNIGFLKDWSKWPKAEGPPSAFERTNRKETLPLFGEKPEGNPSAIRDGSDETNRKELLPPKPEGVPSAQDKDRKIERQRQLPTTPNDGVGEDEEGPGPANHPRAQLVQDTWTALGFTGSPPSKQPAAFSGAMRLFDGKSETVRNELIPWIEWKQPKPDRADTPGKFFLSMIQEKLKCSPGVGWRKELSDFMKVKSTSPQYQTLRGWPSRLTSEDVTFVPTLDELDAMARSPDFDKFQLDRFMSAQMADRIRAAHKQFMESQRGPV